MLRFHLILHGKNTVLGISVISCNSNYIRYHGQVSYLWVFMSVVNPNGICRGTSGDKLSWFSPDKGNILLRIALANIKITRKGTEGTREGSQQSYFLLKEKMQSGWQGNTRSILKENGVVPGLVLSSASVCVFVSILPSKMSGTCTSLNGITCSIPLVESVWYL